MMDHFRRTKNPLSGLLVDYNSESDSEDKMQDSVNSFLNEIKEIETTSKNVQQTVNNWQKCFDESTGYPYYWNIKTDEVTWDMPADFSKNATDTVNPNKNSNSFKELAAKSKLNLKKSKPPTKKVESDSEDEKITLINSYEAHSSSDEEQKTSKASKDSEILPKQSLFPIEDGTSKNNKKKHIIPAVTTVEVKMKPFIGPQIPCTIYSISKNAADVDLDIISEIEKERPPDLELPSTVGKKAKPKETSSISLVAGYGEDSEEEAEEVVKKTDVLPFTSCKNEETNATTVSHSTLFPNTTPIDVNQFVKHSEELETKENVAENEEPSDKHAKESSIDSKAFSRKRRIAMDVIFTKKLVKSDAIPVLNEDSLSNSTELEDNSRVGFGFSTQTSDASGSSASKNGIAFVKAETINFSTMNGNVDKKDKEGAMEDSTTNSSEKNEEQIAADERLKELETTVQEKLSFLCEGREPASAEQIMNIQLATLSVALKAGALSSSYLREWLKATCTELVTLEKEAAPAGWLLKWDRSNKRYFYQNQHTNETQWEYPVADIVGGSEAMDICTTPPPSDEQPPSTPPPPVIKEKSPTPPPPPIIRDDAKEPLPPGIEQTDRLQDSEKAVDVANKDKLVSELDSFYSDIASIESTTTPTVSSSQPIAQVADVTNQEEEQLPKKKKKNKVKISHGLAMKKKEVSKLVEKWKNVQRNYSD